LGQRIFEFSTCFISFCRVIATKYQRIVTLE
jgi:hypothetical protein